MRTKQFISAVMIALLAVGGYSCGGDEYDCPEVVQPTPHDLTRWEKERFPYDKFTSLTFLVEEPGRSDTVVLERVKFDSFFFNVGDDRSGGCKIAYQSRWHFFSAKYGNSDSDYNNGLTFQNKSDGGKILEVKWFTDSTYIGHPYLDEIFGMRNELSFEDTVELRGKVYVGALRGSVDKSPRPSTFYVFHKELGFIYLFDSDVKKKWYLLSTEYE